MTDLSRAEREYERLLENSFWTLFWEEIDKYLQNTYEMCGGATNQTIDEIRVLQGKIEAIKLIKTKPDTIIKDVRKNLRAG